ncbi:unnamed protein product, partial [Heterosigma akashiwo]
QLQALVDRVDGQGVVAQQHRAYAGLDQAVRPGRAEVLEDDRVGLAPEAQVAVHRHRDVDRGGDQQHSVDDPEVGGACGRGGRGVDGHGLGVGGEGEAADAEADVQAAPALEGGGVGEARGAGLAGGREDERQGEQQGEAAEVCHIDEEGGGGRHGHRALQGHHRQGDEQVHLLGVSAAVLGGQDGGHCGADEHYVRAAGDELGG